MFMQIAAVINELERIKKKHGNIQVYLEIGEDDTCSECGEPKYVMWCGEVERVSATNINTKLSALIKASRG